MTLVFDSSALIAFLRGEQGTTTVEGLIAQNDCFVHAINLCEIYYIFRREKGHPAALVALQDVLDHGIAVREDMDSEFWLQAGAYKADLARISLADCFCAALANRLGTQIVTSDHEFDKMVDHGLCDVRFIR